MASAIHNVQNFLKDYSAHFGLEYHNHLQAMRQLCETGHYVPSRDSSFEASALGYFIAKQYDKDLIACSLQLLSFEMERVRKSLVEKKDD